MATVAIIAPVLFDEVPSFLQILGVVVVLGAVVYQDKLRLAVMNRFTRRGARVTLRPHMRYHTHAIELARV